MIALIVSVEATLTAAADDQVKTTSTAMAALAETLDLLA